jgi:hypothetical protein
MKTKRRLIAAFLGIVLGLFLYGIAEKRAAYMGGEYNNEYANVVCWGQDVNTFEGNGLCLDFIHTHCAMPLCQSSGGSLEWFSFTISWQIGSIDKQFRVETYTVIYPSEEE